MTKKERVLLNEDLKSVEEVRATLDELVDFLKKEIVRTRSADKLMEQNKHYEKLVISLGKLAVVSKRWELYDYDSKD